VGKGDLEAVIGAQAALIAALDAGEVATIEAATTTLAQALQSLRAHGAVGAIARDRVEHALKQSDAARTRVNYLADRTRQRLDRLASRRGAPPSPTYTNAGRFAIFGG
jgi:predicted short-subunit dehydrogenase-like oxidoreductase (DUF2520 family)